MYEYEELSSRRGERDLTPSKRRGPPAPLPLGCSTCSRYERIILSLVEQHEQLCMSIEGGGANEKTGSRTARHARRDSSISDRSTGWPVSHYSNSPGEERQAHHLFQSKHAPGCICVLTEFELSKTRLQLQKLQRQYVAAVQDLAEQSRLLGQLLRKSARDKVKLQRLVETQASALRKYSQLERSSRAQRVPHIQHLTHESISQDCSRNDTVVVRLSPSSNTVLQFQNYDRIIEMFLANLRPSSFGPAIQSRAREALEMVFRAVEVQEFREHPKSPEQKLEQTLRKAVERVDSEFKQWFQAKRTGLIAHKQAYGIEGDAFAPLHSLFLCVSIVRLADKLHRVATNLKKLNRVGPTGWRQFIEAELAAFGRKREELMLEGLDSELYCFDEVARFSQRVLRELEGAIM